MTVTRFQQKRGTTAEWAARTTPLLDGEIGVDKDTGVIKMGDGFTMWADLDPIMDSQYLPILGKAKDSYRLDGLASTDFLRSNGKAVDADKLDGNDSSYFLPATGTAADSAKLGGQLPAFYMPASAAASFLAATGKAVDADKLDGNDSTFFMAASAAASFLAATGKAADSEKLDGNDSLYFAKTSDLPVYRRVAAGRALTANATLALTDEGTLLSFSAGGAVTLTIPTNATVAIPIGGWVDVMTTNAAGPVTLAAAAGVTVRNALASYPFKCITPYAITRLLKTATNEWVAQGVLDTGYVTLTLTAPFTVATGDSPWFRKIGNRVQVHINSNYSGTWTNQAAMSVLPVGCRPIANQYFDCVSYSGTTVYVGALSNGNVIYSTATQTLAGANIDFDFDAA